MRSQDPSPWELIEPERTLTDILREVRPETDDVLVATVRTGVDQRLVDVTKIHTGPQPDRFAASELLCRHARFRAGERPWTGTGWQVPQYVFVTVVCRRGRVIPTERDYFWLAAWRYSNHLSNGFDGDVYLVTEHGWTGCIDTQAGFEPRLRPRALGLTVVPAT